MKPNNLLGIDEVVKKIEPLEKPIKLLNPEFDSGSAQTGFCHSSIPYTVTLADDFNWMEMALNSPYISCVITGIEMADFLNKKDNNVQVIKKPILVYQHPKDSYYYLHNLEIHRYTYEAWLSKERGFISSTATIHPTAFIEEEVFIGDNVVIGPLTTIRRGTRIGEGSTIDENCTIGSEGLFTKTIGGVRQHLKHYGGVDIGKNCVIHAGVNISRSVNFNVATILEDNVDCGIQTNVAHDSFVGRETTLSSKVVLAGRVHVESNCWIGAGSLLSNGIRVGHNSRVRIGSVVVNDLLENSDVSGNFARPHHESLRTLLQNKVVMRNEQSN
jgi:acyl-[acyl carrier protein]--UDP-N-acetylglucosamine O-acyltransferase